MVKLQGDFHFSFGTSTKWCEQPQGDFFALQCEPCGHCDVCPSDYPFGIFKLFKQYNIMNIHQGSPHIVKTGRLDFSLSWLQGEVRENLGDFRKSIQILTFLSPLLHVLLPFTKTNNDLKRMQLTSLENKILNIKPCMGHISGTWELLLCEYWRKSMIIGEKNTDLKRLTGRLKLLFLTRNWETSLKPRGRSRPLRLVWWALIHVATFQNY